jgi:hypothetical protein
MLGTGIAECQKPLAVTSRQRPSAVCFPRTLIVSETGKFRVRLTVLEFASGFNAVSLN